MKIVDKNWLTRQAKAIETKNLKTYHKSMAWITMLHYLYRCIICVNEDNVEIDENMYKNIRKELLKGEN